MKYQDGTTPSEHKPVRPEDIKWLEEALQKYMVDLSARMKDIKSELDKGEESDVPLTEKEDLLEELMEIVESIDYARDLEKIGGIDMLLDLLSSKHASLRWRAAEVVATCVQNNQPVQVEFVQAGAIAKLMQLADDEESELCRVKALLALSCLVRQNQLAVEAFRLAGGLQKLITYAGNDDPKVQRKALQLLKSFLREKPSEMQAAVDQGVVPALIAALSSAQHEVRLASLVVLLELTTDRSGLQQLRQASELRTQVTALQTRLAGLSSDEFDAEREEAASCSSLLNALSGENIVVDGLSREDKPAAAAPLSLTYR